MPYSVLQPVKRRRARRRRWPLLLLFAAALAAVVGFAATGHGAVARGRAHRQAHRPAPAPGAAAPKQHSDLVAAGAEQRAATAQGFAPGTPLLLPGKLRLGHDLQRKI